MIKYYNNLQITKLIISNINYYTVLITYAITNLYMTAFNVYQYAAYINTSNRKLY